MGLAFLREGIECRLVRHVLEHPLLRKLAGLDLTQDLFHLFFGLFGDEPRPAGQIAILGRVTDRVAHIRDAALIDQVHDELELMQAFEVGHLGSIPGFDKGLITGHDECCGPAAEHRLLAEEICLRLFTEGGLDDARPAQADSAGISKRHVLGIARRILMDRNEPRYAFTLYILGTYKMAGALGSSHINIHILARHDLAEMDVEPMGESEERTFFYVRFYVLPIHAPLEFIRHEDHDDISHFRSFSDLYNFESCSGGFVPGLAAPPQSDHHVNPAFLEVV